jgi:ectoine hydroxylase-related dioxygenase (phytanoyl-CoA dioxygenase family)
MDTTEALRQLGVTEDSLSADEREQLDTFGFVKLPDILSPAQVAAFNARLDALLAAEGDKAGMELHQEAGTERLADLINKDSLFDVCFTHPRVLAAVAHVLRDFKLAELCSRAALPGHGAQALHTDGAADTAGGYLYCNTFWLLDDFTTENGPTRLVPGTHKLGHGPDVADPTAPHPDEVKVLARAGTVVIFNSHLWHGGTLNTTQHRRRAISSFFCRRDQTGFMHAESRTIQPQTLSRLSKAARYIIGVPVGS